MTTRIKKLDRAKRIAVVQGWPISFGHRVPEVRIGQYVFVNGYSCARHLDNVLIEFERLVDLTPGIAFDASKLYFRRSNFVCV